MMSKKLESNIFNVRAIAFDILKRVDKGSYADRLLDHHLKTNPDMEGRDKRLLTELVYGVLRLRGRLDFALGQFSRQRLKKLEPDALLLLRIGAYQLLQLDRIPAHAAINTTVNLSHNIGMGRVAGLINGTLRTLERQKLSIPWPRPDQDLLYLEHVCSLPGWLAQELRVQFHHAEAVALAEALTLPAPQTLRVNTLKITRDNFMAALTETGHLVKSCRFAPEGVILTQRKNAALPGDTDGWYQVQDEASMIIAHLLDTQPGDCVLDACAAPGTKTLHIAALTNNQAKILALDKSSQRIKLLNHGVERLGGKGIETRCWDLTTKPPFLSPNQFDRILVDAPCSGLGVLRRNPETRWTRQQEDIKAMSTLQTTILSHVAPFLRPGGHLVFSVCTFTQAETDEVVKHFLSNHPTWLKKDLREELPPEWLELSDDTGCLRTFPHRHDNMDAFFATKLMKRE